VTAGRRSDVLFELVTRLGKGLHKEGRVGVAAGKHCLVFMCDIRTV
jgi:hypothetical protein